MLRGTPAFLLLFACLQHPNGATSSKTNDTVVEIISDTSLMGIREVTRVTSLENYEIEGATNILNVWTRNPQTNLSYKVIPYDCEQTPYTYESLCKKESGHLASIHSQQEDSFISVTLVVLGIRSCHCKHIGLYSAPSQHDSFHWRDGTPVNYLNWKVGEPYGDGPRCAYIWQANGWVSGKCTETHSGCCAMIISELDVLLFLQGRGVERQNVDKEA
uniref:C-type lectin domain-containing protein n=1 Tax=Setaria digitata TaxID=48799 RepID=A0A915PXU7_9BILA